MCCGERSKGCVSGKLRGCVSGRSDGGGGVCQTCHRLARTVAPHPVSGG